MSYGTNTAPTIDSHLLVQLLLCIGLPFLVLPLLATVAYCCFRWFKARKNKPVVKDVEQGECVLRLSCENTKGERAGPQYVVISAVVTNSVQVPVGLGRNF